MSTLVSNLLYLFLACLILVFITISGLESFYVKPGPSNDDKLLIINKGESFSNIASNLRDLNLIENLAICIRKQQLVLYYVWVWVGKFLYTVVLTWNVILQRV